MIPATCTGPGYTLDECAVCGDRHITDITPALAHDYKAKVIPATCEGGGKDHPCLRGAAGVPLSQITPSR